MLQSLKIYSTVLFSAIFFVVMSFCACNVSFKPEHNKTTASEMPTDEMVHHDHSPQVDEHSNKDHPCDHCERGVELAVHSTISAAIFAPTHTVEIHNVQRSKYEFELAETPPPQARERYAWLDPPPPNLSTPITLKIRLLT